MSSCNVRVRFANTGVELAEIGSCFQRCLQKESAGRFATAAHIFPKNSTRGFYVVQNRKAILLSDELKELDSKVA